jgi:thiol-disulfide isomerase/thioredoxin
MIRDFQNKWLTFGIVGLLVTLLWLPLNQVGAKDSSNPSVIVLTASWCGTCQEINSVVQRIIDTSPQYGLTLVTLDVDENNAPTKASDFGITITGAALPAVYLYSHGRTVLLFKDKDYHFGKSKRAEELIRKKLGENLK